MKQVDNVSGGLVLVINDLKERRSVYKGFDGKTIWPDSEIQWEQTDKLIYVTKIVPDFTNETKFNPVIIKNGLVPIDKLDDVLKYRKVLHKKSHLLYLQFSDFTNIPMIIQRKFSFLGYDYGNFISEDNNYSLINNEITSGTKEELKAYAKLLNPNLLFPSLDTIPVLEKTKEELLARGERLEAEQEGEEFIAIAVYEFTE